MKKYLKKLSIISLIIFIGIGIYFGNKKLKDEKRWFYSTGTNEVVFGEITWGMSRQEVERILGYQLTNLPENKNSTVSGYEYEIFLNNETLTPGSIIFNKNKSKTILNSSVFPLNVKTNYLIGKNLNDFYNIRTHGICYHFYNNRLFEIIFTPFINTNDKQYFNNVYNKFTNLYLKDLNQRFGRLNIHKTFIGKNIYELKISNYNQNLIYLDSEIKVYGSPFNKPWDPFILLIKNDLDLNINEDIYMDSYLRIRFKPIIEEIIKDLNEKQSSFFK